MAPIILCLLCMAASCLWIVHSATCGIRALLGAVTDLLVYIIYVLLGCLVVNLCFSFLLILFTDLSVFWEMIKEFYEYLGGFWGIVGTLIGIGVLVVLGSFLLPILAIVGEIVFYVATFVLGIVYAVFEFVENWSQKGYSVVVAKISDRLVKNRGGSQ